MEWRIKVVCVAAATAVVGCLSGCAGGDGKWQHSFLVLEGRENCVRELLQEHFSPDDWEWVDVDWQVRATEHISALVKVRRSRSSTPAVKYDLQLIENQCVPYKGWFEMERPEQSLDQLTAQVLSREAAGSKQFHIRIDENRVQVYFDVPDDYQHSDYLEE